MDEVTYLSCCRQAAGSLWFWVAGVSTFVVVTVWTAPPGRLDWTGVTAFVGVNLAILTYVGIAATKVARGQWVGKALTAIGTYCVMWILVAFMVVAQGGGAPPQPVLIAQAVLVVTSLAALFLLTRALRRKDGRQGV